MTKVKLPAVPQLSQDQHVWHMYLSLPTASLDLRIKYGFHGEDSKHDDIKSWNRYRFYVSEEGDNYEVVSNEAYWAWHAEVAENEGEEVATKWLDSGVVKCPNYSSDEQPIWHYLQLFNEMVARWEAMQTLELIRPTITMSDRWE